MTLAYLTVLPGYLLSFYFIVRSRLSHQPHRMAPDQTIRVMESNFDICDGHIRFFPAFSMEFFTISKFSIIFLFQRMEILDISKFFDYIPFPKDGNPRHFKIFRLYSLFQKMEITETSKLFDEILFSNEVNAQMLLIYILTSLSGYALTRKD